MITQGHSINLPAAAAAEPRPLSCSTVRTLSSSHDFQWPQLKLAAIFDESVLLQVQQVVHCSTQRLTSTATIVQADNEKKPRRRCRRSARRYHSRQWCTMALSRLLVARRLTARSCVRVTSAGRATVSALQYSGRPHEQSVDAEWNGCAWLRATAAAQGDGASPCSARCARIHVCSAARFMAQSAAHQLPCPRFGACAARTMPCCGGQ